MASRPSAERPIAFLLGKPLRSGSIIAEVIERVHHEWRTIIVHRPSEGMAIPETVFECGFIVQRGLNQGCLALASGLEQAGLRCVNRISATQTCHDRASVMSALAAVSIPVPETIIVPSWSDIVVLARGQPIVVKTLDGNAGRGVNVLLSPSGRLPTKEPFEGPFIAQHYVPHSSTVQKLYVAGNQTRGLLKSSPLLPESAHASIPFDVDVELQDLAERIAAAPNLDIFGADIVRGPLGPTVIDVNPFPGFRGVPDAGKLIADHILGLSQSRTRT